MSPAQLKQPLLIALFVVLLSACGTNPYSLPDVSTGEPDYRDTSPAPPPASKPVPEPQPREPVTDGPHRELLARADSASDRGEYEEAMAYLERAQRIDPDDAEIYLAMARTHDAAGNSGQARAVAERGLLYCTGRSQCDALRTFTR